MNKEMSIGFHVIEVLSYLYTTATKIFVIFPNHSTKGNGSVYPGDPNSFQVSLK